MTDPAAAAAVVDFVRRNGDRRPQLRDAAAALAGSVAASGRFEAAGGPLLTWTREQSMQQLRLLLRAGVLTMENGYLEVVAGRGSDEDLAAAVDGGAAGDAATSPHAGGLSAAGVISRAASAVAGAATWLAAKAGLTSPAPDVTVARRGAASPLAAVAAATAASPAPARPFTGAAGAAAAAAASRWREPLPSAQKGLAARGGTAVAASGSDAGSWRSGHREAAPKARPAPHSSSASAVPASTVTAATTAYATSSDGGGYPLLPPVTMSAGSAGSVDGSSAMPRRTARAEVADPAAPALAVAAGDDEALKALSSDQAAVLDLVMQGKSVFFTGSAGTGKSFLLRTIIQRLREAFAAEGKRDALAVTAPTGLAACNVGGTTIHSFAGIPVTAADDDWKSLAVGVERKSTTAAKRWKALRCLVVDEISMLDGRLFDKLEAIARYVRHTEKAFGGVQLVLAGDFCQLPPVGLDEAGGSEHATVGQKRARAAAFAEGGSAAPSRPGTTCFCFEAKCWTKVLHAQVSLTQVFRQRDDAFIGLLNDLRKGVVSPDAVRLLSGAGGALTSVERRLGMKATRIFARNKDVDRVNDAELAACKGHQEEFVAMDEGEEPFLSSMQRATTVPDRLRLKVGSEVMLLKNVDAERGLVNGACGKVVGFAANEPGALPSRLPTVMFERGDEPPVTVTIEASEWTSELGGSVVAMRRQLPLKLAYALSIHKAQGMTINLLDVSMDGIFEYGQAYVALSRAVSLDRLRVRGFTPACVRAHPRVIAFYKSLVTASAAKFAAGHGGSGSAAAVAVAAAGSGDGSRAAPGRGPPGGKRVAVEGPVGKPARRASAAPSSQSKRGGAGVGTAASSPSYDEKELAELLFGDADGEGGGESASAGTRAGAGDGAGGDDEWLARQLGFSG